MNRKVSRINILGICLALILVAGCNISHKEKAQQHLLKALKEYEKSIQENPSDKDLQEKFYSLARICLGETQAKIELFLLYQLMGHQNQASKILEEIFEKNPQQATRYLKEKLESEYGIEQRILIYQALAYLNPQDANFFDQLGRLYLGINQKEKGIKALQKSIELGNRNQETINYLVRSYISQKEYDHAATLLKNLIAEKDDIQLHEHLADLYKKQGKENLYLAEMEIITEKKGRKPTALVFKQETHKPVVIPQKPSGLESFTLAEMVSIEPYRFIIVDKSSQQLSVYEIDGKIIKQIIQVVCTTGKNSNDKQRPGDLATPEGTFLIKAFIPSSKLDPKYGAGAYVLDFPDYISKRLNKDGSGIWLHGTPIEKPPYNSEGCIVVNDKDFVLLQPYIEVGKTFIHILKNKQDVNLADIVQVWQTVQDWEKSWEDLDTNRYLSYYDDNFRSDGKDKKAWAAYKKQVNSRKKYVKIELEDTQILPYGQTKFGYVFLVDTLQKYESNDLKSTVRKNLYISKNNGTFRIIGELVK